jgi:hypothetical protein
MFTLTPNKIIISLTAGPVLASGVVIMPPAQAAVLWNNGVPNLESARVSDFEVPRETADNFTLASLSRLTKITWSGVYGFTNTPSADDFSIGLFDANGSSPATIPQFSFSTNAIARTDSGLNLPTSDGSAIVNLDVYNYELSFTSPVILNPGNYLLSIVNNTLLDTDDNWFWARSASTGNSLIRINPTDPWGTLDPRPELAFAIEGTVISSPPSPPPSPHPEDDTTKIPTPALLPGLIGMGLSLWRQRHPTNSSQEK